MDSYARNTDSASSTASCSSWNRNKRAQRGRKQNNYRNMHRLDNSKILKLICNHNNYVMKWISYWNILHRFQQKLRAYVPLNLFCNSLFFSLSQLPYKILPIMSQPDRKQWEFYFLFIETHFVLQPYLSNYYASIYKNDWKFRQFNSTMF